jgi:hypothetical protein
MADRRHAFLFLALVTAAASRAGVAADAFSGRSRPARASVTELTVEPRARLANVTPHEVLSGPSTQAVAVPRGGGLLDLAVVPATVVRHLPALWELRLPVDYPLEQLRITFEVFSGRGVRDELDRSGGEGGGMSVVELRPTPPEVVRREGNEIVVQGGAVLELDVAEVQRAGRYGGSVRIVVDAY